MIKNFIIKNLVSIHSGGVGGKLWSSFQLATFPAVGLTISERITGWYLESHIFIMILVGSLIGDLVLGVWKHLGANTFSFKKMLWGFSQKLIFVNFFYFFSEAFLQILSDADLDGVFIKVFLRLMLFLWPAGNALVNMGIVTNGKFPPLAFLKKIDKFNKTLKIEDLNIKNERNETDINSDPAE